MRKAKKEITELAQWEITLVMQSMFVVAQDENDSYKDEQPGEI